jgi:hypothetical protein
MNKTSVGKIDFAIAILSKDALDLGSGTGKLEGDLKYALGQIFQDGSGRSGQLPKQVATLGDDGFTGDQRGV